MRKLFYFTCLNVLLVAGYSCKNGESNSVQNQTTLPDNVVQLTESQYKQAGLEMVRAFKGQLPTQLKVSGKIDVPPQNMVSVGTVMGGILKDTRLLPGMHISKGDVLAVMEDQDYIELQKQYLEIIADLKWKQTELSRQKALNESKAVSDKTLQQTEAEVSKLIISRKALASRLLMIGIQADKLTPDNLSSEIRIYSPINGYVTSVNVNIGKHVSPGEVLFELVNPDDIHLSLTIYEKDLDKIYLGQKLYAYTNQYPERKHVCEVILIGKQVKEGGYTEVHCHFDDYDKDLVPGLYMNALIDLQSQESYLLPEESIVKYEGSDFIFTLDGERRYKMISVKAGNSHDGKTEWLDAAADTSRSIVGKGAYTLLMALKNTEDE